MQLLNRGGNGHTTTHFWTAAAAEAPSLALERVAAALSAARDICACHRAHASHFTGDIAGAPVHICRGRRGACVCGLGFNLMALEHERGCGVRAELQEAERANFTSVLTVWDGLNFPQARLSEETRGVRRRSGKREEGQTCGMLLM